MPAGRGRLLCRAEGQTPRQDKDGRECEQLLVPFLSPPQLFHSLTSFNLCRERLSVEVGRCRPPLPPPNPQPPARISFSPSLPWRMGPILRAGNPIGAGPNRGPLHLSKAAVPIRSSSSSAPLKLRSLALPRSRFAPATLPALTAHRAFSWVLLRVHRTTRLAGTGVVFEVD